MESAQAAFGSTKAIKPNPAASAYFVVFMVHPVALKTRSTDRAAEHSPCPFNLLKKGALLELWTPHRTKLSFRPHLWNCQNKQGAIGSKLARLWFASEQ